MIKEYTGDIGLYLFGFFDVQTLGRCGQVCKKWHNLANNDVIWKAKLAQVSTYKNEAVPPKVTMQLVKQLLKYDEYELSAAAQKDIETYKLILATPFLASKLDGALLCDLTISYPETLQIILDDPQLCVAIETSEYLYSLAKLNFACAKLILSRPTFLTTISELLLGNLIDTQENIELLFDIPGLASRIDHCVLLDIKSKYEDRIQSLTQEKIHKNLSAQDIHALEQAGYIVAHNLSPKM